MISEDHVTPKTGITAEARSKLVSWLIAVRRQLKLSFESCCLAVNIMDRFLITTSVAADCFQLLGVTSLLIATKQVSSTLILTHQLHYKNKQLCNLECLILLRLHFRLAAPTHTDGKKWKWLACKVCELSLADYTFNKYMPSVIVLCAVKLAKDLLKTHSAQPTDNKAGSSKTLESFGFQEYATFEAQLLVQQCTEDLKLLVSLNQDAVQDFISPLY
uniref:Cyclin-like domain-containing protein n=1 Tax=Sinocyclocheilus anshuiensis TaxID=1608454 RepID=A0A671L043_9TELE